MEDKSIQVIIDGVKVAYWGTGPYTYTTYSANGTTHNNLYEVIQGIQRIAWSAHTISKAHKPARKLRKCHMRKFHKRQRATKIHEVRWNA